MLEVQETKREIEARRAQFSPAYSQLVALIAGRLRYKDFAAFEGLHEDEKEEFRRFRHYVSDTLLDAACKPICTTHSAKSVQGAHLVGFICHPR